ncbi:MAG: FG-GAP repeat domain-containing protein, partial [Acidobacteriota bacterium]
CAYWASQHTFGEIATPIPYHDANDGGANTLLANDGRWGFTDVTARVGLDANNHRWSFAASWEDFDNDGDPDLYVANDFGRNNLYRNEGGTFVDITASAGVEDMAAGMSATWGDYDQDGWMDIYVSNMFSSAGTRVTAQKAFKPDVPSATKARYQRHARGNSLLHNVGDGTFRDVSVQAGVTRAGWAWGSKFIDFDNDGREDLLVANGYLTREDTGDL